MRAAIQFLFGMFIAVVIFIPIIHSIQYTKCPVVLDLPEEWRQISHNKHKTETLCGYLSGDTLYLQFNY